MWFNNITRMWTTKKELAGAHPTSGSKQASPACETKRLDAPPHPLIGKTFRINDDNPFEELYCVIRDVRKNKIGIEYVSYSFLNGGNGRPMTFTQSERLETFDYVWKEVK